MAILVGTPSDDAPAMLATGRTDITTLYVSMSARDAEGRDADYLAWHSLDHRPEQHRLKALRASLRLVSTPACRAARATRHERFDATDHLMTYFFTDVAGLPRFNELSTAIVQAGRTHRLLPVVERAVYSLKGTSAAPRIKVGADVLPWWPTMGVYVLVERAEQSPSELIEVPGVGGVWWGGGLSMNAPYASASNAGLQISYCFLDEEPVQMAQRLRPVLEKRWNHHGIEPLLAAPFHAIVPYAWDRFLP